MTRPVTITHMQPPGELRNRVSCDQMCVKLSNVQNIQLTQFSVDNWLALCLLTKLAMCIKCPFWNLIHLRIHFIEECDSFWVGFHVHLRSIWSESQCVIQLIWCPLLSVTSHDGQGWAHHPSPASHWSDPFLMTSHWLLLSAHHLEWLTGPATWDYTTGTKSCYQYPLSPDHWEPHAGASDMWWCHQPGHMSH